MDLCTGISLVSICAREIRSHGTYSVLEMRLIYTGFTFQETRICQEMKGGIQQTSSLKQASHSPCILILKVCFFKDKSQLDQFLRFWFKILCWVISSSLPQTSQGLCLPLEEQSLGHYQLQDRQAPFLFVMGQKGVRKG